MGNRIGSLYAEIGVDTTKLQKGLGDAKQAMGQSRGDMQRLADETTRLGGDFRRLDGIIDDWIGTLRSSTPENAKFAQSIDNITREFNEGKLSAQQAADKLEAVKLEMDKTNTAAKNLKSGLDGQKASFSQMMGLYASVAAGLTGIYLATKKVYDLSKEGASLEYAAVKFDRLAASAGTTANVLLKDLREATKGTRSDMELMGSAGDFMALGLAKTADQIVRLTKVAGGLGMDMNQLVLTLANHTTMRFDQLGVSVDGFDKKVAALKKTGMDANAAFTEAFLQQAEKQLIKVGNAADQPIGAFNRFEAAIKNNVDAFKRAEAGPFANFLTWGMKATKGIDSTKASLANLIPPLKAVEIGIELLNDGYDKLTGRGPQTQEAIQATTDRLNEQYEAWLRLQAAQPQTQESLNATSDRMSAMAIAANGGNEDIFSFGITVQEIDGKLWLMKEAADGAAGSLDDVGGAAENAKEKALGINDVELNLSGKIKTELDKIEYYLAGGLDLQKVTDDIAAAITLGADNGGITPEQGQALFAEAYVAEQKLQTDLNNITAEDAAKNIADTLGVSIADAKKLVQDLPAEFAKIPKDIYVTLHIDTVENLHGMSETIGSQERRTGEDLNGNGIIGRASGGPVMAGMPYWVGERGPELVMPKTSGQVISTEDLRDLFSGARGNIEINVYGADDPQRTANLIGINFRAAQALAGVA